MTGPSLDFVDRSATPERVRALRAECARQGIAGVLIPRNDEHFGEWVPAGAERLAYMTGFTGSAGLAIVLAKRAAVFVDGRYTLQVRDQVDLGIYETRHITDEPPGAWLKETLRPGDKLGFDPWLHTDQGLAPLRAAAAKAGAELVAVEANPVDVVWSDRPAAPKAPVVPHPEIFTGESASSKRHRIAQAIKAEGRNAAVLTLPESIAWLLNIRGADVPRTPLPLSFAVLHDDASVDLYVDPTKLSDETRRHLGNEVRVERKDAIVEGLDGLNGRTVVVDRPTAVIAVTERLKAAGATVVEEADPCLLPKARKNAAEIGGARAAHIRDGAAVSRFLAWLDHETGNGGVDEITAAERLEAFRREDEMLRDLSFDTISGAGPNGAIVHYRVSPETNRRLEPGSLYLVDSGAQYLDGTTDITRTIAIGEPTAEMRERFTRVLKGHIAIATARFPKGTTGSQLDPLARIALWQAGLDFDHGTGHGVGSYLGVHEGPQRISKVASSVALEPGMIISNEPGYYKTGAYGIRIENLVVVSEIEIPGGERPSLGFQTLTMAPIDRRLVEPSLLTDAERAWLDGYHREVRETLRPLVDAETGAWLADATRPI